MRFFLNSIFACVLFAQASYAQHGLAKKADVDQVRSRVLLVVKEEIKEELAAKLDGDEKAFYKEEVGAYNAMMSELIPKYWKLTEKVEFKTRSEIATLIKSKSKDFAYLQYSKFSSLFSNAAGIKTLMKLKRDGEVLIGNDYKETDLEIRLTENNPLGNPVYGVYMPSPFPTKGEMVYGLKQLQNQLRMKGEGMKDGAINDMYKENARSLPKYTLLLDRQRLKLNVEEIKKYYPFPYEIVDKARIDEAFVKEEEGIVTFVHIPRAGGSENPNIVDTKEGREMARTSSDWNTGIGVSTSEIDAAMKEENKGKIRKDDLKIIAKQAK